MKFPHDAPQRKVLKTLEALGFVVVRRGNHISLVRNSPDGTMTPLTTQRFDPAEHLHTGGNSAGRVPADV